MKLTCGMQQSGKLSKTFNFTLTAGLIISCVILKNLTAAVRKIANSTAEHICRVLHKASSGSRKDLTRPDQVNHTVEQQFAGSGSPLNTHIKDEEHVKGGSSHN